MNKECKKCDDRGMIKIDTYSSKSCECGYHNRLMQEVFKNISFKDLISYGNSRIQGKKRLTL